MTAVIDETETEETLDDGELDFDAIHAYCRVCYPPGTLYDNYLGQMVTAACGVEHIYTGRSYPKFENGYPMNPCEDCAALFGSDDPCPVCGTA